MPNATTILHLDTFHRIGEALSSLRPEARKPDTKLAWYLPGFTGKSRVSTLFGDLPIEALRQRDDLRTYSGAAARVQLVDRIHLEGDFLRSQQSALPLRIPANAFGPGRPSQDMLISPGQEICADAHIATRFQKAMELRDRFNPDLSLSSGFTYYRFHCGAPTIVKVDGLWVRVSP
ncbi:MAG TPA: Hint domain-containing protein [Tabrizicola sp.]|nr:Hint domain-containing protein [Tabrizicola sp.]